MEKEVFYLALLIGVLVYIIPVLKMRIGLNRRKDDRRLKDRRVATVHMPIERRRNPMDRRGLSRRG